MLKQHMRRSLGLSTLLLLLLLSNRALAVTGSARDPLRSAPAQTVPPVTDGWAFSESFDGDPPAPSQALLPQSFDYVVTHRTHPAIHFDDFPTFVADHDDACRGPDPAINPLPQHVVQTSHRSRGEQPDASFYICKNHMMSAMGEVEGYSVSAFWPKQEFYFGDGGVLEFDVNISGDHPRTWWEVMITPRRELKVGAAHKWLPIDETYPKDRIVFTFGFDNASRQILVGAGALEPDGVIVSAAEGQSWAARYPNDAANNDRRIRRTMRIRLDNDMITWSVERADGSFDDYVADVPGGLPFAQGLVVFKTHAYTPTKEGNRDNYTFHWDNIRFSGPVVGRYVSYEAAEVVYLQANGNRAIGESATVSIELPEIGEQPRLFGQVHNPMRGQVLLRINGGAELTVDPYDYNSNDCFSGGWKSFQLALDPAWLQAGENTFTWTIGPRPDCVEGWIWNGFSIKSLEVQFDQEPSAPVAAFNIYLPLYKR